MGSTASAPVDAESAPTHVPDASLSSNVTTAEENERKKKLYAHLRSAAVGPAHSSGFLWGGAGAPAAAKENVIEQVYNEDFESIDRIQAMRFPPYVAKQIKNAVRNECERRCAEMEKTMSRCLQDKMWTSWKCQKERDAYYHCVEDEERRNTTPCRPKEALEGGADAVQMGGNENAKNGGAGGNKSTSNNKIGNQATAAPAPEPDNFVDLLTAYRWKFNLGVLHGEIIGRNNVMRQIWKEHFPDRDLPHPWVKDDE